MPKPRVPIIIDIEASGIAPDSYPIEVGLAMEDGQKYCSLIFPAPEWTHWDVGAQKVHGISRDTLETYGQPMRDVTAKLNDLVGGKTLYTDGWVVDKPWLTTLFYAARTHMAFTVSPLEAILSDQQMRHWHSTKDAILAETDSIRHRASADAWVIQETYRRTAALDAES